MSKILMSIKPEHADNIISGIKVYEFRKVKCKRKIDSIVIYSTSPVKQVIGEVEVRDIIEGSPEFVWNITHEGAGIDKQFYDSYFSSRNQAVAYCLGQVKIFKHTKSLEDFGIKIAPQSFVYI